MLVQVLLACEALASVSLAILMRTHELRLRTAVLAVNFSLMSQETARVREALQLGA